MKFNGFILAAVLAACQPNGSEPDTVIDDSTRPLTDLPYAQGLEFATLDAYLAHRETLGATDRPYYRRLKDGAYELVAGRRAPGAAPEIFTREDLLEKYGFAE